MEGGRAALQFAISELTDVEVQEKERKISLNKREGKEKEISVRFQRE